MQVAEQNLQSLLREKLDQDTQQWQALVHEAEKCLGELSQYHEDLSLGMKYPLMLDARCPTTAAAYRHYQQVRSLAQEGMPTLGPNEYVANTPLALALDQYREALMSAEALARQYGDKHLDDTRRHALKRARMLWALSQDDHAQSAEREQAYVRVQTELSRVSTLPTVVQDALAVAQRQITSVAQSLPEQQTNLGEVGEALSPSSTTLGEPARGMWRSLLSASKKRAAR